MEQKTFLNDERLEKFSKQLNVYDTEVQDWLINIYNTYDKQINRSIASFLKKEDLFLLYHTDNEFRSCSYDCYAQLIKKNPFLKDDTERLFQFIKDYHQIQSQLNINTYKLNLTEEIDGWIKQTWNKYNVNIWAFVKDYTSRFYDNDQLWTAKHRIKSNEDWRPYHYDIKQKTNLFYLNTLYPRVSNKPFIRGKKQYLEILMMYIWLHEV